MPETEPATAQTLKDEGIRPRRPTEILRETVLDRYNAARKEGRGEAEALQRLFPNTILDEGTLKKAAAALVSGSHVLLLGPPGSGKTSLAKDIWDLYPKDVIVVEGCPVQDDPFSLFDEEFAHVVPPCPYCKTTYGQVAIQRLGEFDPKDVDPGDVPIRRARLREGHGLARIQGSPEVFPDNLTGAINIAKLEEIGDPNSPLVMEPGKVLQANRGVLMIDEIGKLPRGTQNVLLQALQESIVTPAKSRETFPASFVAVATSNLQDLDNVTEPLIGRIGIVYVGFNDDHAKNVDIVRRGAAEPALHTPRLFHEASAGLVGAWRRTAAATDELGEVGSNRTMIDVLRRAQAHARLEGRKHVVSQDYITGAHEAMTGRIRARGAETFHQNTEVVEAFLKKRTEPSLRDAAYRYWCAFYVGELNEDKAEGLRTLDAVKAHLEGRGGDQGKVKRFREFVTGYEGVNGERSDEVLKRVFDLLESNGAFEEKASQ
jgi:magnesium chelatase subunit I